MTGDGKGCEKCPCLSPFSDGNKQNSVIFHPETKYASLFRLEYSPRGLPVARFQAVSAPYVVYGGEVKSRTYSDIQSTASIIRLFPDRLVMFTIPCSPFGENKEGIP